MLSCDECRKYLHACLDLALDIRESLDVQEHLHTCTSCAEAAEAERTLRVFVRRYAVTPALPEHVKRQIIRHAMRTPSRYPAWWPNVFVKMRQPYWKTGMAAAAAALLAAFVGLSQWSDQDDFTRKIANEASMAYRVYNNRPMPLEVEGPDDTTVTQWFYKHIGYRLPVPDMVDQKTQLMGGRLCRVLDRTGAAVFYRRQGANMLLFAFKDDKISLPAKNVIHPNAGPFYVRDVSGRQVAVWQRGGIIYSLVGDLDREALLQIASTGSYR
jgi:anti-sigma factor RsiW